MTKLLGLFAMAKLLVHFQMVQIKFNPLAAVFFYYPPIGMEIIFYIPSSGAEFIFSYLPFDTDFFLCYSSFPC